MYDQKEKKKFHSFANNLNVFLTKQASPNADIVLHEKHLGEKFAQKMRLKMGNL